MSLNYSKKGNLSIDPEDIDTSALYAFTFNPEIQPLNISGKGLNSSLWQFDPSECLTLSLKDWYKTCHILFNSLNGCELTKMICEISKNGRYHFHGCIQITDIMEFYTYAIPLLNSKCHYAICPIHDYLDTKERKKTYATWDDYLAKQQKFIVPFFIKKGVNMEITKSTTTDILYLQAEKRITKEGNILERKVKQYVVNCSLCSVEFLSKQRKTTRCENCQNINYMPGKKNGIFKYIEK